MPQGTHTWQPRNYAGKDSMTNFWIVMCIYLVCRVFRAGWNPYWHVVPWLSPISHRMADRGVHSNLLEAAFWAAYVSIPTSAYYSSQRDQEDLQRPSTRALLLCSKPFLILLDFWIHGLILMKCNCVAAVQDFAELHPWQKHKQLSILPAPSAGAQKLQANGNSTVRLLRREFKIWFYDLCVASSTVTL